MKEKRVKTKSTIIIRNVLLFLVISVFILEFLTSAITANPRDFKIENTNDFFREINHFETEEILNKNILGATPFITKNIEYKYIGSKINNNYMEKEHNWKYEYSSHYYRYLKTKQQETEATSNNINFVSNEIIIKFQDTILLNTSLSSEGFVSTGINSIDKINRKHGLFAYQKVFNDMSSTKSSYLTNVYKLIFQNKTDVLKIVDEYNNDDNVIYAEPNYIVNTYLYPNDPDFNYQWALDQFSDCDIDAPEAWSIEAGNENIIIAIIDTGVDYTHPDLVENIWFNSDEILDGIDNDDNGYIDDVVGWDFVNDDNDPLDDYGHGTHCAGIASAVTDNNVGIAGVCWNCSIMSLKGLDEFGYGSDDDLANAIAYAADNDANVISMSWGSNSPSKLIKDALFYAYSKNVTLVAAAGNDNTNSLHYPSGYDNVIAVAATNRTDNKAGFSNYGSWVDIAAPGVNVYSTMPTYYVTMNNYGYLQNYDNMSGTSMACPYVAGLAGLILSKNNSLSPMEIKTIVRSNTDNVNSYYYIGIGRINANDAIITNATTIANLNSSLDDASVQGVITLYGTAYGPTFWKYAVYYGEGNYPDEWFEIKNSTSPVVNDVLATLNTSLSNEGYHSIRLLVYGIYGEISEDRLVFTVELSENSVVFGFVTNENNGSPIEDAWVDLYWEDDQGHWDWNYTYTDSSGFYSMNTAAGEIQLYVYAEGYFSNWTDWYTIGEDDFLWIDITLDPRPSENSIVFGFVTNENNGSPIEDAWVDLYWEDDQGHWDWNYTYTDSSGFYSMNTAAGEIQLYVYAEGYFSNWTDWYTIGEDDFLWIDITLDPRPSENSIVFGFVTNENNGSPIEDAWVDLYWEDDQGHWDWNYTYTDSSGFYSMNVAAGTIDLYVAADGYFSEWTEYYNISANETLWLHISLYPRPPENSIVCGYVTDTLSGLPIEYADVDLSWYDEYGHWDWNYTYTDSLGFYSMNVADGEIQLDLYADDYFYNYTDWFEIDEYETLWLNVSLHPRPPENSIVCGFVTDESDGSPIEDAWVYLECQDDYGHWDWNYTYTDSLGFYSMNVAAGTINISLYPWVSSGWINIEEYQNLWLNFSVENIPPFVDFNYTPSIPTINDIVYFNDTSIDLDGTIAIWLWDFGDGNTSTSRNTTHQYTNILTYDVTLTVTDDDGCNSSITKQIITKVTYNISLDGNETTIKLQNETDLIVIINTTVSTIINITKYSGNPTGENILDNITSIGKYLDIEVENESTIIWPITINIYYTEDDLNNSNLEEHQLLGIYFWNDSVGEWQLYNDTGVNTTYNQSGYEGYCWANAWHLTPLSLGGDAEPPTKVTGLTVNDAKDGKLNLAWNEATDNIIVDHYKVYRGGSFLIDVYSTSYLDTGLVNGQSYTYNVSAVDLIGNVGKSSDSISGTPTASDTGGGGGGVPPNGGGGDFIPPGPINEPPIANANGPYYEIIDVPITFDGSESNDSDGTIESYEWDFGDGTTGTGITPTQAYANSGNYTVALTVTDDDGATGTDTTYAVITGKPNLPPNEPIVNGTMVGRSNIDYNFSAMSTDPDNDSVRYVFDWDEGLNLTFTDFVPSGTEYSMMHNWTNAGLYIVKVYAEDVNSSISGTVEFEIFIDIDVLVITELDGYLLDYEMDGVYDKFYYNFTLQTEVELQENGEYKIDSNGDGEYDCTYDPVTGTITSLKGEEPTGIPVYLLVLLVVIIIVILMVVIVVGKYRKG